MIHIRGERVSEGHPPISIAVLAGTAVAKVVVSAEVIRITHTGVTGARTVLNGTTQAEVEEVWDIGNEATLRFGVVQSVPSTVHNLGGRVVISDNSL